MEGGCIIANDDAVARQLMLYRQFGHVYDEYFSEGINAKNSEFHAAMGLCVLPRMEDIIAERKKISEQYDAALSGLVQRPFINDSLVYNYGYYPVVLKSEAQLLQAIQFLKEKEINGRRYFYPSLNELPYLQKQSCPVSEDVSRRVLCLPLYPGLEEDKVKVIIECMLKTAS